MPNPNHAPGTWIAEDGQIATDEVGDSDTTETAIALVYHTGAPLDEGGGYALGGVGGELDHHAANMRLLLQAPRMLGVMERTILALRLIRARTRGAQARDMEALLDQLSQVYTAATHPESDARRRVFGMAHDPRRGRRPALHPRQMVYVRYLGAYHAATIARRTDGLWLVRMDSSGGTFLFHRRNILSLSEAQALGIEITGPESTAPARTVRVSANIVDVLSAAESALQTAADAMARDGKFLKAAASLQPALSKVKAARGTEALRQVSDVGRAPRA